MSSRIVLRPAEEADGPACAAIYAPFVLDTVISFEQVPPDGAEMAARLDRATSALVAEVEDVVMGYAYAAPHRDRAAYRYAVDFTVYLAEPARGRGIGRRLYEQLVVICRELGLHRAYGGIALPNEASVRLHESVGFRPVGVYERVGWKLGAWHDVGWWQLDLVDPALPPRDG